MAVNASIRPLRTSRAITPQQRARLVLQQRGREPLLVALDRLVVLHQLLVEHVQDRLAGDVGDVGGALHRGAAERAQVHLALLVAVEGDADVLEVHDLVGRLRAHDLDRVLVAEEVRALDRVVGVRAPVVVDADRGVDAAGGRDRVRAHRVDLAHDRHARARSGGGERRALAGEAGADDQDVVCWHGSLRSIGGMGRCGRDSITRGRALGPSRALRSPRAQRLAHLRERDDALQHAVGVDRDHRARAGRGPPSRAATPAASRSPMRTGRSSSSTSTTGSAGRPAAISLVDALLAHDAEEVARRVDDREPRPAVAQEELLLGVEQRRPRRGSSPARGP